MHGSHPVRQSLIATVVSVIVALSTTTAGANPLAESAQPFALYVSTDQGRAYQPIDPGSLEDADAGDALTFDHDWPHLTISADGSTSVTIDPSQGPLDNWITVHDGLLGATRLTITVEEAVFNPRLSVDGERLVVEPSLMCGPSGCSPRTLYTYDTRTGELISKTATELTDTVWPDLLAPAGDRLHVPYYERATGVDTGPWQLWIATFDLESGRVIDRMTVPGVLAGSWQAESIDELYVGETVGPAIALAPDGSRIAVVDAPMQRLTLIDTATLEVVENHEIHAPESATDRLLGWLGIAPQTAEAKVSRGRWLQGVFAADGQHLYLTGHETDVGDTYEEIEGHGFGLMRIDTGSGQITASTLDGLDADLIVPAPDGESVYVLRQEIPWWEYDSVTSSSLVERRDADTLEPMAERRYDAWAQIMLVPMDDASG